MICLFLTCETFYDSTCDLIKWYLTCISIVNNCVSLTKNMKDNRYFSFTIFIYNHNFVEGKI